MPHTDKSIIPLFLSQLFNDSDTDPLLQNRDRSLKLKALQSYLCLFFPSPCLYAFLNAVSSVSAQSLLSHSWEHSTTISNWTSAISDLISSSFIYFCRISIPILPSFSPHSIGTLIDSGKTSFSLSMPCFQGQLPFLINLLRRPWITETSRNHPPHLWTYRTFSSKPQLFLDHLRLYQLPQTPINVWGDPTVQL
jgi:hypothetical protein